MSQSLIKNLLTQVTLTTDEGIYHDLLGFFRGDERVINHEISRKNNVFNIDVTLKDLTDAREMFSCFVTFMQYSHFSFYCKESQENTMTCHLISGSKDLTAFYCIVTFKV